MQGETFCWGEEVCSSSGFLVLKKSVARARALACNIKLLHGRMGAQEVGISAWALATLKPKGWRKVIQGEDFLEVPCEVLSFF